METLAAVTPMGTPQCSVCSRPAYLASEEWASPDPTSALALSVSIEDNGTRVCSDCLIARRIAIFMIKRYAADTVELERQLTLWCGDKAVSICGTRFAGLVCTRLPRGLWACFDTAWSRVSSHALALRLARLHMSLADAGTSSMTA